MLVRIKGINKNYKRKLLKSFVLLSGCVISAQAYSAQYGYAISTSYEDSTNLSGFAGGEAGDTTQLGLNFSLEADQTREWSFNLSTRFEGNQYSLDTVEDEDIYNLDSTAIYTPQNTNFSLTTVVSAGQVPINRFRVQNINNLRDEEIVLVRPRYFVSFTRTDRINFVASYFDYTLDESEELQSLQDSSNTTSSFLINYEKQVNATNIVSMNLRTAQTEFKDPLDLNAIDYDRDDMFFRWVVQGRTNQIQVDLGESKIVDDLGQELKQDLQIASFTRQLNQNSQFELIYSNSFNNQAFGNQATGTISLNQQNSLTGVQKIEEYEAVYRFDTGFLTTELSRARSTIEQVNQGNEEERKTSRINIRYALNRLFNSDERIDLSIGYSEQEGNFDTLLTNITSNRTENTSIGINYLVTSNFQIGLTYTDRETEQFSNLAPGNLVDTQSTTITFLYRDRGRF